MTLPELLVIVRLVVPVVFMIGLLSTPRLGLIINPWDELLALLGLIPLGMKHLISIKGLLCLSDFTKDKLN